MINLPLSTTSGRAFESRFRLLQKKRLKPCILTVFYIFYEFIVCGRTIPIALLSFIGFLFTLCWAVFGTVFQVLFSTYAKITNIIMAILLVYCAISVLLTSL